jgi:hypothetical protein
MTLTIDDIPAGWLLLTCEVCHRMLPEGSFTEDENYEDCTICHDCHKRELFLQASRLIVSLNDERICALAACNWGRAERLKHLMNRARVRARRRHSYPSTEEISNDEDIYDLVGWNRR